VAPTTTLVTDAAPTDPRFVGLTDAVVSASVGRGDAAVSIAVVEQGRLVHTAVVGDGLTPATGFRLASVSKFLVAATVLQLVDRGLLELEQRVVAAFDLAGPFRDPRTATVTVRQLLSHTSGLPARKDIFFRTPQGDWRQNAIAALDQSLQFEPGRGYQYSNLNFVLLGALAEHVSGQDIETLMADLVGGTLDAGQIRLAGTFDTRPGEAPYATGAGRHYMEMLGPAGGMVAPAAYVALAAGQVHAAAALTGPVDVLAMRTPQTPFRANRNFDYGLGTMLWDGGWWGHSGSIEMTRTVVVTSPGGITVAVLVSGDAFGTGEGILDVIRDHVS
jgi:CubicO group peptidase (beta-lactamase class C family)